MKPPYRKENISILDDEYMKEQGFEPVPINEKIDYVESWIIEAENEMQELIQKRDNIDFYGPKTPTKSETEQYGTEGKLTAKDFVERRWKSKLRKLEREIKNKENAIKRHKVRLKKFKKIQRDQQQQTGDKIDQWIQKNIPNSTNKGQYKKAFEVILDHPKPKDTTYTSLIDAITKNHKLAIGEDSLRKQIPKFVRELPL